MTEPALTGSAGVVIVDLGDAAVLAQLDAPVSAETSQRLAAMANQVQGLAGVHAVVCGLREVAVHCDPLVADRAAIVSALEAAAVRVAADAAAPATESPGADADAETGLAAAANEIVIPVRYTGPDLAAVAAHCGLSTDAVIARHTAGRYTVATLGFVPGFAYLHGLDPALGLPRREQPRRVRAGSVAIAVGQAGIYPAESPGGWHVLGFADPVVCGGLAAGDRLRFVAAAEDTSDP